MNVEANVLMFLRFMQRKLIGLFAFPLCSNLQSMTKKKTLYAKEMNIQTGGWREGSVQGQHDVSVHRQPALQKEDSLDASISFMINLFLYF